MARNILGQIIHPAWQRIVYPLPAYPEKMKAAIKEAVVGFDLGPKEYRRQRLAHAANDVRRSRGLPRFESISELTVCIHEMLADGELSL